MKMKTKIIICFALASVFGAPALAQSPCYEELANLPFAEGRPTKETAQKLRDELLFQRATQTYLWALPLINTLGMKVGSEKAFGAGYNVLPVWKERLDAKTLVTTPNSDVIYAMSYVDLGKDGPLVYRSATNNVFVFLRSFYQDPKNLTPAVALVEQAKIYPLNGEAGAKPMKFPDASGIPVNMLPTSDGTVFDQLKQLVDSEGANLADPDGLGMLAAIGIVKGQPFTPDANTRTILDQAAKIAYKMSRVIGFEEIIGGRSYRVYPDRRWVNPLADGTPSNPTGALDLAWTITAGGYLALDARINFFTNYYSISPGMVSQTPGKGAKYMIAFTDNEGEPLSGASNYRLKLPPNIPAANFWSVTLYNAENSSGLDNGQPFPSLGLRDKPAQNADGSTDLYLGPKAPEGKEGNWLATVPGKGYFAILRLYAPTEAAIDKSWKPGDIVEVQ